MDVCAVVVGRDVMVGRFAAIGGLGTTGIRGP
jgi:hypothetical protein